MAKYIYIISWPYCTFEDEYSEAVVIAESENDARRMHPDGMHLWNEQKRAFCKGNQQVISDSDASTWTKDIGTLEVMCIGAAMFQEGACRVIMAKFHAA